MKLSSKPLNQNKKVTKEIGSDIAPAPSFRFSDDACSVPVACQPIISVPYNYFNIYLFSTSFSPSQAQKFYRYFVLPSSFARHFASFYPVCQHCTIPIISPCSFFIFPPFRFLQQKNVDNWNKGASSLLEQLFLSSSSPLQAI